MDPILIVDDNHAICRALELMLELHGYRACSVHTPHDAQAFLSKQDVALVIQDMNFSRDTTSGVEGRDLFFALRAQQPNVPIILLTAWTELAMAVALIKEGAADYLGKPWDDDKLLNTVANLIRLRELEATNSQLARIERDRQSAFAERDLCGVVFASGAMQRTLDLAIQVAPADVSVLITGPNGVGKDKIANVIHANSPLRDKPFIKVDVGALPLDLMEAELFGAEAGAFTGAQKTRIGRFEAADGGTLFLDEIGNLPMSGQMKLLRVLQTGEFERLGSHKTRTVNVRVLSATNSNLTQAIAEGKFREDLYYRLNVINLPIAPLSERRDDILPLARRFLGERWQLTKPVQQALLAHHWPGNVRELENACKRASLLAQGEELQAEDFGLKAAAGVTEASINSSSSEPSAAEIEAALLQHKGVVARAAKVLGLSRQALYRRMEKFGIQS
ncbi:sigma-54-dependent transcriptional regulator [Simiduia aestuariiviva]|uniref:DNA-binding NtrC family response regulator n=1 Tax=Simiduia aestuariiviva TaxID=1510459 RepID=A0A839UR70_9GAMM|nr:sigma-54 dependent transcriptional regulator [Simiduia aestuariiviva]MBB3169221.1 DNA-binding NtrC family response regulator [Simiduia aestuariiviva]